MVVTKSNLKYMLEVLLLPYIVVLLVLDESRGTGPYVSLSMMTTRDTMTAGTPETYSLSKGLILSLKGFITLEFVD